MTMRNYIQAKLYTGLTKYHFSLTIYYIFQGKKKTLLIVIKGNPTTYPGFPKGNNSRVTLIKP